MRKPMTDNEFYKVRVKRQKGFFDLINDLHDAKFSSLFIESMAIGTEDYYMRVIIDRDELGSGEIESLQAIADNHNGIVTLRHDYKTGSRLAIWINND
jgi:hypothetical protein